MLTTELIARNAAREVAGEGGLVGTEVDFGWWTSEEIMRAIEIAARNAFAAGKASRKC